MDHERHIRQGKSKVSLLPPLTLGSDLPGVVEEAGPALGEFKKGDEILCVTNPQFCGRKRTRGCRPSNMVALRLSPLEPLGSSVSCRGCGHRLADDLFSMGMRNGIIL